MREHLANCIGARELGATRESPGIRIESNLRTGALSIHRLIHNVIYERRRYNRAALLASGSHFRENSGSNTDIRKGRVVPFQTANSPARKRMTKIGATSLHRVYCAGPLFNQAERAEMTQIAQVLCSAGFQVYLPHRDGMEFRPVLDELVARGWPVSTAGGFLHAGIFALDVYQLVVECGSMVWNLNGRVPDEGAVSEAAMAWMLGKPMVGYKDDFRSLISSRDNPLLAGLVDFELLTHQEDIPEALHKVISSWEGPPRGLTSLPPAVQRAVGQGGLLWAAIQEQGAQCDNLILADVVTELFAPKVPA